LDVIISPTRGPEARPVAIRRDPGESGGAAATDPADDGAATLGAAPITIAPIFSGLASALIFGLFASTVFTLFVIPVAYWLVYGHKPGHGVQPITTPG